jgi:ATP-binding cassette subfamily F protein 3
LTEADIYEAHRKAELQSLLSDQAYCSKELTEIEETWMALQEELERLSE